MDRETAAAIIADLTESEKLKLYEVLLSIERQRNSDAEKTHSIFPALKEESRDPAYPIMSAVL